MISIIIPFKNTSLIWLERLFASLQQQKNQNFEVICLNDQSDNGIDYHKIIKKHKYRYYYNANNKLGFGVGKLRDFGVQVAKGDYIWFIDSDDWITPDAIDYLLQKFQKYSDLDLIVFKYQWVFCEKDCVLKKQRTSRFFIAANKPKKRFLEWFHKDFQTDWRVCFKKQFLIEKQILHQDHILVFEDVYFGLIWKTLFQKALFSRKILYFYNRMNQDSILNKQKYFNYNNSLLSILSSKHTLIERKLFHDNWYFYANNWAFVAACMRPYKKWKKDKKLIKELIGPKHYRNHKMLGWGLKWWIANIVIWIPFLVLIFKKILNFKIDQPK